MNKLRTILFISMVLAATVEINAVVRFGIRAGTFLSSKLSLTGVNVGNEVVPVPDITKFDFTKLEVGGFGVGPVLELGLPFLGIETGLLYAQQNFVLGDAQLMKATLYQVEMPLGLKLRIGVPDFIGVFASAGVIASYQVVNAKLTPANSTNLYDERFRMGAQIGAGVQLFGRLELGASYQMMLRNTNLVKEAFVISSYHDPAIRVYLTYYLKSNSPKSK